MNSAKQLVINSSTQRPCKKIIVDNVELFKDIADERLDDFLLSFTEKEGLIIHLSEDELEDYCIPEGCNKIYHPRAVQLYERMIERFMMIGRHYFPDDIHDIELSSMYIND